MKKVDLAYIAGILDGEGCIHITRSKRSPVKKVIRYQLELCVVNSNEWLMEWLHFAFGGYLYLRSQKLGRKKLWSWQLRARQAGDLLKLLLPYLRIKKFEAEVAIQFQDAKISGKHFSPGERAVAEAQYILMRNLKKEPNGKTT